MKKIIGKTKAGEAVRFWASDDELFKVLRDVDWSQIDNLKIESASVPVLPTQTEQEALGKKDQ